MKNIVIGVLGMGFAVSLIFNLFLINEEQNRIHGFTSYISEFRSQASGASYAAQLHLENQTDESYHHLLMEVKQLENLWVKGPSFFQNGMSSPSPLEPWGKLHRVIRGETGEEYEFNSPQGLREEEEQFLEEISDTFSHIDYKIREKGTLTVEEYNDIIRELPAT
ncbi:hypothetical protein [Geomicrobium sp. JCM 19039]|uniref:hypothetical protein n=1 Tax=Geomicrobium sp. JCM 19039 TaxID=1460636 RepID=UPI00045F3CB9|nr:hypothetical protein [Geomicrobium sp. JCM 19039]GAK10416.1 hypothetical protein JCM19039_24 [Geomicrobium sp. JCM 19039]